MEPVTPSDQALQESEERFRALFERAAVGVAQIVSHTGEFVLINQRYCDIVGYTREEMTQRTFQQITHPDDLKEDLDNVQLLLAGAIREFSMDKRYFRKDGSIVWVNLTVSPMWEPGEEPDYHIAVVEDITRRVLIEGVLQESMRNFRDLVENSPDGIIIADQEGHHLFVNRRAAELTGYSVDELLNITIQEMTHPDELAKYQEMYEKRIKGEPVPDRYERLVLRKDGTLLPTELTTTKTLWQGKPAGMATIRDISERRQAEAERERLLVQAEATRREAVEARTLLDNVFERISDGVVALDEDWHYTYVNRQAAQMLNREKPADLIGTHIWTQNPEGIGQPFYKAYYKAMETQQPIHLEEYYKPWDRWFKNSIYPSPDGLTIYFTEITGHKQAEQARQESEDRYRLVSELTSDFAYAFRVEPDGSLVRLWVTGALQRLTGLSADELAERGGWEALIFPDDLPIPWQQYAALVAGRSQVVEYRIRKKDGTVRWMRDYARPEWDDAQGRTVTIYGAAQDITERVQAEQILRQRAQEMAALNSVSARISRTLSLGQVISEAVQGALWATQASAAFLLMREGDELIPAQIAFSEPGREFAEFPSHKLGECLCGMAVTERRAIYSADIYNDPRCTWEECKHAGLKSAAALPLFRGEEIIAVLGLGTDSIHDYEAQAEYLETLASQVATGLQNALLHQEIGRNAGQLEQRVRERTAELGARMAEVEKLNQAMANLLQDLQAANRKLEATSERLARANQELETFAYSVSHDLKAPLRGIDGYSQLLLENYAGELDQQGQQFLHTIRQAAGQMSQLIEDLLAYSRLERRPWQTAVIDPRPLVESAVAEWAEPIREREVVLTVDIPCQRVAAEADGLLLVLRNLLSNALKFTANVPQPRIEIGGQTAENTCVLWVRDNGVGFDMRYHDRIFEIFQRLHRAEDYPGTGVGLAIVRRAMERMNGRVWAESEPGRGATFYLEIPRSET